MRNNVAVKNILRSKPMYGRPQRIVHREGQLMRTASRTFSTTFSMVHRLQFNYRSKLAAGFFMPM